MHREQTKPRWSSHEVTRITTTVVDTTVRQLCQRARDQPIRDGLRIPAIEPSGEKYDLTQSGIGETAAIALNVVLIISAQIAFLRQVITYVLSFDELPQKIALIGSSRASRESRCTSILAMYIS